MIRVLLVDDQPLVREGLRTMLEIEPDLHIVDEADDGDTGYEAALRSRPDVALIDARMPRVDGPTLIGRLARETRTRCLVLTTFEEDEILVAAIQAGACGYLLKDATPEEIIVAIRRVHAGETVVGRQPAERLFAIVRQHQSIEGPGEPDFTELSPREREIVRHLLAGLSNREIASRLYLSEGTVKNHVSRILRTYEVRDRTQLVLRLRTP